jgi:dienelactone hydrolase
MFCVPAGRVMTVEVRPDGWTCWPDREDLSVEFMRLLASAQEGGSTVSECWLAASRVDPADDSSWYREWSAIADANYARAAAALSSGHLATARRNWLRAMNYYQAAAYPIDLSHELRQAAVAAMRDCAINYLRHRQPAGEVVSIPWLNEFALQGYFLSPRSAKGRIPTVICIGEPGHRKEELLFKVARHACERGIALLAVDLLGEGISERFEEIVRRHQPESAIERIVDYLIGRDDVDADRIAIFGDNWGSSFVARGIAFDQRFAAAVCDGGVWDAHERAFIRNRAFTAERVTDRNWDTNCLLRTIQCPVLVTVGEKGWLESNRVVELTNQIRAEDRDLTLKIFRERETAAAQGHLDNPTLANEFIFDWIESRLRQVRPRQF